MPMLVPFIPLIAAVAGPLLSKAIGGGGAAEAKKESPAAAAAPAAKALFSNPADITKATDQYKQEGLAKWNQIFNNMGAAGGTGGVDINSAIGNQATSLAGALGGLTDQSGYGNNPSANMAAILRGVEPGIGAKYPVY